MSSRGCVGRHCVERGRAPPCCLPELFDHRTTHHFRGNTTIVLWRRRKRFCRLFGRLILSFALCSGSFRTRLHCHAPFETLLTAPASFKQNLRFHGGSSCNDTLYIADISHCQIGARFIFVSGSTREADTMVFPAYAQLLVVSMCNGKLVLGRAILDRMGDTEYTLPIL